MENSAHENRARVLSPATRLVLGALFFSAFIGLIAAGMAAAARLRSVPDLALPWKCFPRPAVRDRALQITFFGMLKIFDFIFLNLEP
ncbi:MAG: hypothetical protein R6U97_08090 [Desulfosalsimonas sp.]